MDLTGSMSNNKGLKTCIGPLDAITITVKSNAKTVPSHVPGNVSDPDKYFNASTGYSGAINYTFRSLGSHSYSRDISATYGSGRLGTYTTSISASAVYDIQFGSGSGGRCENKTRCADSATISRSTSLTSVRYDATAPTCTAKTKKSCYGPNETVTAEITAHDEGRAGADDVTLKNIPSSSKKENIQYYG